MTDLEKLKYFGINLPDWQAYIAKRLSDFKVQKSFRDENLDPSGAFDKETAYNAVAFVAMTAAIAAKPILNKGRVFEFMLPDDQQWVRTAIFNTITFLVKNRTVYENITGTQINTPNYQFNSDTSRNVIDNDVLGTYAKQAFKNSTIDKYKLVQDQDWDGYQQNSRGEYQIIKHISVEEIIGGI